MRRRKVDPSPSIELTRHPPAVVARHVTDDRQTETGTAGLPRAGPVDAVEALEDPVEITIGDPDAVVVDDQFDAVAVAFGADTSTSPPRSEYLTAFSTRLPSAETN